MRGFIRVVFGVWLLIVIVLVAGLATGHMLYDGEIIAFQSSSGADTDIYVHDVSTGVTHNLTGPPRNRHSSSLLPTEDSITMYPTQEDTWVYLGDDIAPAWSPNGRQLAFASYRGGNLDIYRLDLDTGRLHNLTDRPGPDTSPVWSPNGTKLAFESMRNGQWGVSVIDLEAGIVRDLTDHMYANKAPAWSPDSRQIAFQSRREGYWDIYIIELETGEIQNLTNSGSNDFNPVWSPARS